MATVPANQTINYDKKKMEKKEANSACLDELLSISADELFQ